MSTSSASTLLDVATSYKASDVLDYTATHNNKNKPSSVIVVDSKMTPLEAATLLWENNIMGAPVYDKETKTYVGMFDARDILSCVTAAHREFLSMGGHHKPGEDVAMPHDVELHHKTQRELMAKALQHIKIDTKPPSEGGQGVSVAYLAKRNPMTPSYSNDSSLLDICKALAGRHKHRVAIIDPSTGICTGIISQSGLVAFIASKCPSMDEKMEDANLNFRKKVVQVLDSDSAACAFELLDAKRLSGIAVVDEEGKLIGNTSARDVKLCVQDAGKTGMDTDILSYLARVRQSQVVKDDKYPTCHVHEDSTVRHVVNLLAKTGYHRVFVVDKELKPVGVISFADIINWMLVNGGT